MRKPKRRPAKRMGYWSTVKDDHLLSVELMIDDPTILDNLVFEVPEGDEEPHIEFVYDQRNSGREKFHCVHENHPHLFGCVMNKGGKRFLVGWICGKLIYGEDFKLLKKDFYYAVDRQQILRRVREVKGVIHPFLELVRSLGDSDRFDQYEAVKRKIEEHLPWLFAKLEWHTNYAGGVMGGVTLPKTLFDGFTDPRADFSEAAADISNLGMLLIGKAELEKDTSVTLGRMQHALGRLEAALAALNEMVEFFQPAMLAPLCEWATANDNPKKRKYRADFGALCCARDKGDLRIKMPKNYTIPNLQAIETFRTALSGFG